MKPPPPLTAMNPRPFSPDNEPLAQSLRQLQPSATPLDPAIVFYRMGLAAGRRQATRSVWPAAAALVLAASLSAVIVGPVGYRLGQASSGGSKPSAPATEVLPRTPAEPMLAQSEPAPFSEPASGQPLEPASTAVATSPAQLAEPNVEELPPERLADLPVLSWPSLNVVIANWLWGDLLERPSTAQDYMLTRRLTAGHNSADWLIDGVPLPTGIAKHPGPGSSGNPNVGQSAPRLQRQEPLRASDWKEIVDGKHRLY